ncbi:GNAT family N-acetyltransferase [Halosquirtibacter xylanolyticus]|uniref:GNAT family N-acetyltransferase n=1 Tax=Halosquirtibacter xylanolyticus TaxID=3374599 RepID=UPI003747C959|nr:GNAT family N-acetyltransferase [Prolixibacteraceae bacterium]
MDNNLNETFQIEIRQIHHTDYPQLIKIYRRAENMKYIPETLHSKSDKVLIERWKKYQEHYDDGFGIFAIVLKDTQEVIGEIGLFMTQTEKHCAELGIIIDYSYWKKGVGKHACDKIFHKAYLEYGIQVIIAQMFEQNRGSIALVEKLGFKKESFQNHTDGTTSFCYKRKLSLYGITK